MDEKGEFRGLPEAVLRDSFFKDKPLGRLHAWLDLVRRAATKDTTVTFLGLLQNVSAGQCVVSKRHLAERWGWTRPRVDRFIEQLSNKGELFVATVPPQTLLTFRNLALYKFAKTRPCHPRATQRATVTKGKPAPNPSASGLYQRDMFNDWSNRATQRATKQQQDVVKNKIGSDENVETLWKPDQLIPHRSEKVLLLLGMDKGTAPILAEQYSFRRICRVAHAAKKLGKNPPAYARDALRKNWSLPGMIEEEADAAMGSLLSAHEAVVAPALGRSMNDEDLKRVLEEKRRALGL